MPGPVVSNWERRIQEATSESSPGGGLRQDGEGREAGQRSRAFRRVLWTPLGLGTLFYYSVPIPPYLRELSFTGSWGKMFDPTHRQ